MAARNTQEAREFEPCLQQDVQGQEEALREAAVRDALSGVLQASHRRHNH